jgi:hypothetical protein
MKPWLALTISLVLSLPNCLFAQAPPAPQLQITILEGEGALNNIKQQTAREPIVQVQDENHNPVVGALVIFTLPQSGASGTFADGSTVFQGHTDALGQVKTSAISPNKVIGKYQIQVDARYHGLSAHSAVTQQNYMGSNISSVHAAGHAAIPVKAVLIVAAVAAGVAVGVVVATQNGGSPGASVTPSTSTVGAPPAPTLARR